MKINRWWEGRPQERFWLEITDRSDLGRDLNAPQRKDDGKEFWGYSLIREIKPGDVVFHYHRTAQQNAIVARSIASGSVWEDEVLWGAHGTSAVSRQLNSDTKRL